MDADLRLKKLEIYGFKSFADRVEMRFDQGVTGIVGPNGCREERCLRRGSLGLGEQSAGRDCAAPKKWKM